MATQAADLIGALIRQTTRGGTQSHPSLGGCRSRDWPERSRAPGQSRGTPQRRRAGMSPTNDWGVGGEIAPPSLIVDKQGAMLLVRSTNGAIHHMRSAQDQRLANLALSPERNMARILELMQQGNTGVAERTPMRQRPNPPLAHKHHDRPVEEGGDSAMVTAAAASPETPLELVGVETQYQGSVGDLPYQGSVGDLRSDSRASGRSLSTNPPSHRFLGP
ncbi:hypothetical protein Syun_000779 [Stephania yunnanensis]|uniref:Uncharacterized protein n=1 Tax=Stephania yunnanensis TaxID=152371 RepID=A0AAP0Q737_9MAGN